MSDDIQDIYSGKQKNSIPDSAAADIEEDEVVFAGSNTMKADKNADEGIVFYNSRTSGKQPDDMHPDDSEKTEKPKRKIPKKRLIINITSIFLAVVMILAGSGSIVAYVFFTRINYQAIDSGDDVISAAESKMPVQASQTNASTYEGKLMNDKQILNILLIGADTRYNQTAGNSDTMIIMSIDTKNKKIKLLSLMRDTYVAIPGYDGNKLNASFAIEGANLTVRTIQLNYGIQIDRYAIVDFRSFRNIIDALGGLDIELTQEEVDYIDWQCWTNNQVETRHEIDANSLTYKAKAEGEEPVTKVHLNGRQALWHARNRGEDGICSGDDYVRTMRQRNVISLMINDLKKADIPTMMNIIYEIGPMITTNLKTSEITALAQKMPQYLKYDIVSQSAPDRNSISADYYFDDIDYVGNCIIIIDWEDFRNKIAKYIFTNENLFSTE